MQDRPMHFKQSSGIFDKYISKNIFNNLSFPLIQKLLKQDKYTMDPGQSSLSKYREKIFWSKMICE